MPFRTNGGVDVFSLRLSVIVLGIVAIFGGAGITFLSYQQREVPPALAGFVGAALGAIATALLGPRNHSPKPQ